MTTDLGLFEADNAQSQGKRILWPDRRAMIHEHFTASADPPWDETIGDDATFERVLQDILKFAQQEKGRDGPRPNLDWDKGIQSWRELTGQDFTGLPFDQAFRLLARYGVERSRNFTPVADSSLAKIARATGLSRSRVHRLITGAEEPDLDAIEAVARAYNKKPGYFAEWRARVVANHIIMVLAENPEFSASVYSRVAAKVAKKR